jgi:hypothetical protein
MDVMGKASHALIRSRLLEEAWELLGDSCESLSVLDEGDRLILTDGRHRVPVDMTVPGWALGFREAVERLKHRREWYF